MLSCTTFQCHPPSSYSSLYSCNPLSSSNFSVSFINTVKFVPSAESCSSRNPGLVRKNVEECSKDEYFSRNGEEINSVEGKTELPIKEKWDVYKCKVGSKLQVEDFIQTVTAVPSSQRNEVMERFIHNNGRLQSISEFNTLLMALVTVDEFELALELKSKLLSLGFVPDNWTYSILVSCYCKRNDPNEAKTVLRHMLERGFQPNVATLTTLVNAFCQSGRLQEALKVFDVMRSIGCEPTINTYNCLLKGLCYVGRVEEAYELLMNMNKCKSYVKPDIYTYTAVMDGFCKVGMSDEALELLDEALEMGMTPNVVTYNTLFNGYFKEARPLDGIGLLKQMKERSCKPDFISYSTLLHGLLKWGEMSEALGIYKEMSAVGFEVDERMLNTLLRGLCRLSRKEEKLLEDVYEVFERLRKGDYAIYPETYELVIEAFCNGKLIEKALLYLNEMIGLGYSPRTNTFNIVIRALCLGGEVDKALAVLILIHKDRKPGRIPFNILINELNRQGRSLDACNVYGAALKRGVLPKRKPRNYTS